MSNAIAVLLSPADPTSPSPFYPLDGREHCTHNVEPMITQNHRVVPLNLGESQSRPGGALTANHPRHYIRMKPDSEKPSGIDVSGWSMPGKTARKSTISFSHISSVETNAPSPPRKNRRRVSGMAGRGRRRNALSRGQAKAWSPGPAEQVVCLKHGFVKDFKPFRRRFAEVTDKRDGVEFAKVVHRDEKSVRLERTYAVGTGFNNRYRSSRKTSG